MHPYIPHLLADIAAACREDIPEEETEQTLEEHFEAIERWVSGEEVEHTFGYYCGLDAEIFPPADQLSDKEMKTIIKAFEKMMYTWNHGIDLPKSLPAAFAYKMTVDSLNMKTSIVNSGSMSFDFCSGNAPDCIFKEYCPCLKIWNEKKEDNMDTDLKEDELPF
mgnify:FL=1